MEKLTRKKEAELKLVAQLTFDATLAAEVRLSKLKGRALASSKS